MATENGAVSRPSRPMKVLSLGMARTGTSSMATAYTILGYKNVHHGLDCIFTSPGDYEVIQRASDATYPYLETYTGVPFTRSDWDEVFGPCEAVTDLAAFFAPQLIEVYPEAKVVLVERDIDTWFRSTEASLEMIYSPINHVFATWIEPFIGSYSGPASWRFHSGWFEASTLEEAKAHARQKYRKHNETIRKMVPPERLLEFQLADGWGPLCKFLGKEVPDVPFPRKNDAKEFQALKPKILALHWRSFTRLYGRRIVAITGITLGVWAARYQGMI